MFFSQIKRQYTTKSPLLKYAESLALGQRVSRCLDDPMQRKLTEVDSPNLCLPHKRYLPSVHEPPSVTKLGDSLTVYFFINPMDSYLMECGDRCSNALPAYPNDFKTKHPAGRIDRENVPSTNEHKLITTINSPPFLSFLRHNRHSNYGSHLTSLKKGLNMSTFDSIPCWGNLIAALRNKNLRKSLARPPGSRIFSICIHSHNLKRKTLGLNKVMQMGYQAIRTTIKNRTSFLKDSRFISSQLINDSLLKMGRRYLSWRNCLRSKTHSAKPHDKHKRNKYFHLSMPPLYSLAKKWQKRPHGKGVPLCAFGHTEACPVLESPLNFNSLGTSSPLAVPRYYIN